MTVALLDYQILALIMIGVAIGSLVWYIIDLRSTHKDMKLGEFTRRVLRDLAGLGFDDRVVRSNDHRIDSI